MRQQVVRWQSWRRWSPSWGYQLAVRSRSRSNWWTRAARYLPVDSALGLSASLPTQAFVFVIAKVVRDFSFLLIWIGIWIWTFCWNSGCLFSTISPFCWLLRAFPRPRLGCFGGRALRRCRRSGFWSDSDFSITSYSQMMKTHANLVAAN